MIPAYPTRDRLEMGAHWAMGLAVVFALSVFFVSLGQVSDQSSRIAQVLRDWSGGPDSAMIAGSPTNRSAGPALATPASPRAPAVVPCSGKRQGDG